MKIDYSKAYNHRLIYEAKLCFSDGYDKLGKYRTRANKGRGFYSRIILSVQHNGTFLPNFVHFYRMRFHKIQHNIPIFGNFFGAATIQERPLLVWVRYRNNTIEN